MYVSVVNMSKSCCVAFVLAVICLWLEADAQPTVDETMTCSSSTLEDVVNKIASNQQEIRHEIRDVKKTIESGCEKTNETKIEDIVKEIKAEIRDEIRDVKTLLVSGSDETNETRLENVAKEIKDEIKDEIGDVKKMITAGCDKTNETTLEEVKYEIGLLRDNITDVKKLLAELSKQPLPSNCVPLLIQQNVNGSDFFNRSWAEFKVGFTDSRGNYWLGNELLSQLTANHRYKLKFDLQSRNTSKWYYAEYSTFRVMSEAYKYRLQVSGYSGNAGRDAFGYSNGMMFSTYDRDNDRWPGGNCAVHVSGGGFWYNWCSYCRVNAARSGGNFNWYGLPGGRDLQSSRMWLQRKVAQTEHCTAAH